MNHRCKNHRDTETAQRRIGVTNDAPRMNFTSSSLCSLCCLCVSASLWFIASVATHFTTPIEPVKFDAVSRRPEAPQYRPKKYLEI